MSPKLFALTLDDIFEKLHWNSYKIGIERKSNNLKYVDCIVFIKQDPLEPELFHLLVGTSRPSLNLGLSQFSPFLSILRFQCRLADFLKFPIHLIWSYPFVQYPMHGFDCGIAIFHLLSCCPYLSGNFSSLFFCYLIE